MRFHVYVDGFNLYYGLAIGQPHKWLNIKAFAESMLQPGDTVDRIYYCTAEITGDDDALDRQRTYFRALETLPGLSLEYGLFVEHTRYSKPVAGGRRVEVFYREEKGSDVNLASFLVRDAALGSMDAALVMSNDSDLTTPIWIATQEFGIPVGVAMPLFNDRKAGEPREPSKELLDVATFVRTIKNEWTWRRRLRRAQFDDEMIDVRGATIKKPAKWATPPY